MQKFSNAFDVPQCKHNLGANLARRGAVFCYSELWPLIVAGRTKGEADRIGWRGVGDGVTFFPETDSEGVAARGHPEKGRHLTGLGLRWILSESFRTLRVLGQRGELRTGGLCLALSIIAKRAVAGTRYWEQAALNAPLPSRYLKLRLR